MALTLEDILNAPADPDQLQRHLQTLGALMPEPAPAPSATPTVAPAKVSGELSPVTPTADRTADRTLSPVTRKAPGPDGLVAPDFPEVEKPAILNAPLQSMLSFKSREELPSDTDRFAPVGEGIHPAAKMSDYFRSQAARLQDEAEHPYGSAENHPGLMGKVGHVLSRIGNIAGDIVAPATMALIPGTDLNRTFRATNALGAAGEAQEREVKEATEQERTKHDIAMEDANVRKMDQIDQKLLQTDWKDKSKHEIDLRKQGLKPNPADPDGPPIPVPRSEMSELEQNANDLKMSQQEVADARAEYLRAQSDPNSIKFKQAAERLRIAAQNARTAAGRLGLEVNKYSADYLGLDSKGQPLPGVEFDEDTGKPIGPRVANSNKITSTSRSMAEMARTVLPRMQEVKNEIDTLADSVGPAAGRWNELLVNKGGADFPEFAQLDTDLDLLASAIVRTHFGARGGQEYRGELRRMFGEAQSPEDLKARIDGASGWIQGYAEMDRRHRRPGAGPGGGGGGATATPGGTPTGKTYSQKDVDDAVAAHPGLTADKAEAAFKAKGYKKK